jgi:hypothetical protein
MNKAALPKTVERVLCVKTSIHLNLCKYFEIQDIKQYLSK